MTTNRPTASAPADRFELILTPVQFLRFAEVLQTEAQGGSEYAYLLPNGADPVLELLRRSTWNGTAYRVPAGAIADSLSAKYGAAMVTPEERQGCAASECERRATAWKRHILPAILASLESARSAACDSVESVSQAEAERRDYPFSGEAETFPDCPGCGSVRLDASACSRCSAPDTIAVFPPELFGDLELPTDPAEDVRRSAYRLTTD